MRLSQLAASTNGISLKGDDIEITGIVLDSRKATPGSLFIAIPGVKQDGTEFIIDALRRGASAVALARDHARPLQVPSLECQDIRAATSAFAATYYPNQPKIIAAVTGTSGKTSTAQFIREIWQTLGHPSASIGTLGLVTKDGLHKGDLTTPDSLTLHEDMDKCSRGGITHLAMEASSHGIELKRLDHVHLSAGVFTNLSLDHLDYHGTMENYFAAKRRLFDTLLPEGAAAVINADIPEYAALIVTANERKLRIISFGRNAKELRLISQEPADLGQHLHLELYGKKAEIFLPVIGAFQAWNALAALGAVIGCDADVEKALAALGKVTAVPGRLQWVGTTEKGGSVFVDYAHKPDALESVLNTLRPHVARHAGAKLGVVFGCGGNRDASKRPIMGGIAERLADWMIVTDDNPRDEDPALVRAAILAGCKTDKDREILLEIGEREEAIATAIQKLGPHDVVVIAGKGHESGQTIRGKVLPFDDVEVAARYIEPSTARSSRI